MWPNDPRKNCGLALQASNKTPLRQFFSIPTYLTYKLDKITTKNLGGRSRAKSLQLFFTDRALFFWMTVERFPYLSSSAHCLVLFFALLLNCRTKTEPYRHEKTAPPSWKAQIRKMSISTKSQIFFELIQLTPLQPALQSCSAFWPMCSE